MKLPRNFFKPLAIGAPTPLRELPVKLERMIHFVPPHLEKLRARVPELIRQVDVVLGNLEDAIPAEAKEAARVRLHRDGEGMRFRRDRIVDAHQCAQLALGARRRQRDRRRGRRQARRDHAAEGRRRMGHPLPRPASRPARSQTRGEKTDPHPRDPRDRRRRRQCRRDRGGFAAHARHQPRTGRPRGVARHEDNPGRRRTSRLQGAGRRGRQRA